MIMFGLHFKLERFRYRLYQIAKQWLCNIIIVTFLNKKANNLVLLHDPNVNNSPDYQLINIFIEFCFFTLYLCNDIIHLIHFYHLEELQSLTIIIAV